MVIRWLFSCYSVLALHQFCINSVSTITIVAYIIHLQNTEPTLKQYNIMNIGKYFLLIKCNLALNKCNCGNFSLIVFFFR